ncbi:MAG: hypothetical protein ABIH26_13485, partial [Candidatus Eisenbacteria bacterium]
MKIMFSRKPLRHWTIVYLSSLALAGTVLLLGGRLTPPRFPLLAAVPLLLPALLLLARGRYPVRSSLLLLSLGVLSLGRLGVSRIDSTGETAAHARAYARVEESVGAQADSLLGWASAIAEDDSAGSLLGGDLDRREREALFGLLGSRGKRIAGRALGEGTSIEIYREGEGEPAAWWGEVPDLVEPRRRGPVRMTTDPLRVHLAAEAPVRVEGKRTAAGIVRVVRPIGRNPDLAEGVGREVPFARRVRERIGEEVRFYVPGGEGEHVLRDRGGLEIGRASVVLPSARERVRGVWDRSARAAALLLLLFWASFLPWGAGRETPGSITHKGSVRSLALRVPIAALLLLRALLLLFDLPARLGGGGGITGPAAFSSPTLFGAWKSPLDAAITGLVLFLVFLSLRERAAAWVRSRPAGGKLRPLPVLFLLLLLAASTAGFGALVREVGLSTTLGLFEGPNPIGSPPALLVEIALFFAAAGYLFLVDALFVLASVFG